jgi:hypothetical protein
MKEFQRRIGRGRLAAQFAVDKRLEQLPERLSIVPQRFRRVTCPP